MKRINNTVIAVVLLFMTCCISFGYAALADNLSITGLVQVEGKPYKGVYITSVELVNSSNLSSAENSFVLPTNHVIETNYVRANSFATYKITVFNNTDVTHWYIGPKWDNVYNQNSSIGAYGGITIVTKDQLNDTSLTFNSDDWIPPQTTRDFYVTYNFGSNAPSNCSLMVNFHFDIRMDAVHDEFLSVLNNVKSNNSYEYLAAVFDQQYAKNGSLSISTESHPEVFQMMFEDLMVDIDGVEKQAHVVIRRENLDKDTSSGDNYSGSGPSGCEYTLYITVESLTPGTNPKVYAIAYSDGSDGMGDDWYQVGELYEGTAPIKADGSIDYANWVATQKTYEIADGIKYNVGMPNGDQYDIMKTMEELISAQDQDIFNDIDNRNIFKKVYDIIKKHPDSTDPAVLGLEKAFEDASIFYRNLNNGQEFKVVRDKYTRAEIIRALKDIQSALDYYYQVYPQ